jgi:hypothetical protein
MNFGPPTQIRFSEDEAISLIEAAGFKTSMVRLAGPYHYLITSQ